MIEAFRCKETEGIFKGKRSPGLPPQIQQKARNLLIQLDAATRLQDLNLPGNKLHPLKEDRSGQHAMWINKQWRICFYWNNGNPNKVEIVDYH